ncbi:hypothetical protein [Coleofasciculus sp. FACHB-125]|nr:hypothetical protein [Coleofasciculus sp. FACHB-125]
MRTEDAVHHKQIMGIFASAKITVFVIAYTDFWAAYGAVLSSKRH